MSPHSVSPERRPTYRRQDGVVSAEVGDEVVLLNAAGRIYHALNPTGALLWSELARGATEQQLTVALTAAYHVEPGIAARDVRVFLERMDALGLVHSGDRG